MEQPEIEIGDLLIRPWRPEDASAVHRACQDPEIHRWTPIGPVYEMADALRFVTDIAGGEWKESTGAHFGVFDAASGELLASMALVRMDPAAGAAELGYWTAPWARGLGVATRAGRAVSTWAFDVLGLTRVVWRASPGNHASRLVALRIGFRMEGTQRALFPRDNGGRLDAWTATILPGEVLTNTPSHLAPGSREARRAAVFGAPPPVLDLPDGLGALRAMDERDIDAAVRAIVDPETVRWTTVPLRYERADAEAFINQFAPARWREGGAAILGITDSDGAYVGGIDLRLDFGDDATGEIGFQVAPWARGKGYATAAMRAIAAWGFDALGLQRIVWRADVGNHGSRRVAEKAGFTYEGIQRAGVDHRGERHDVWVAAMIATDPRPTGEFPTADKAWPGPAETPTPSSGGAR